METNVYNGEIAISGFSGRFPESANMEEFRQHLRNKEDMVTTDNRRYEPGLHGTPERSGKLKELRHFDAEFFGVHSKQADTMDPQLRIMLEVCYEAILDAGQTLESVKGTRTGVFMGVPLHETMEAWSTDSENLSGYCMLGCHGTMNSNRISFFFDFKGPSYSLDTACSSTLMGLDQAIANIRNGAIDAALVGGSNLCMKPNSTLMYQRLGLLSSDGACKAFDASGSGFCRAEAVGALFLQKSADCRRIYTTVVHSRANSDGYKQQGITFPSGVDQKKVIERVYRESGISPLDVAYVETHGTGTKIGDPQELNTLAEIFCKGRKGPLKIGSTKSNMGHAETAAATASLAKLIIATEDRVIPANLHYNSPNPDIPALTDGRFQVISEPTPWNGGYFSQSAFGFGGTNVHAIYRSHNKELTEPHVASQKPRLFTYSARTEDGVRAVLSEAKRNASSVEFQALIQHSANMPTRQMPYRGYTVLNASTELEEIKKCVPESRPVWFVFSGMGSQWHGMGRKMMELDPFRESILRSTKTLSKYGVNLYDLIMNGVEDTFNQVIPSFIGITSFQVALVDVLFSMDIKPDGIIGHSLGEVACGYADGSMTAEEAVLVSYLKAQSVIETDLPKGMMAAVGLTWAECEELCPEGVVPACHNSEDTVTIAGEYEATSKFVEELKAKGIFAREVNSSNVAYHSSSMNAIIPKFQALLSQAIVPKRRSTKWVSTSVPENRLHEEFAQYAGADYHANNVVSPVLFHEGLQKVPSNAIAIEIGAHCLLQSILKKSLSTDVVHVGVMKKFHENNIEYFFSNIGRCFAAGMDLNPLKVYPPVEYPVPRGTPMVSSCISKIWDHSALWAVPSAEDFSSRGAGGSSASVFDIDVSEESADHYLVGHKVDGRVLYPAAGYLTLAWRALARLKGQLFEQMPVVLKNICLHRATILSPTGTVSLSVSIMSSTGEFEICERDALVASGTIHSPENTFMSGDLYPTVKEISTKKTTVEYQMTRGEVYKELRLRGYEYGPTFQGVSKASHSGSNGELIWNGRWISFMDTMLQLQVLSMQGKALRIPTRIQSVKIDPKAHPVVPSAGEEPACVPVFIDRTLDMAVSGGIEMQGVHVTFTAMRGLQTPPSIEEHRFVPHTAHMDAFPTDLKNYFYKCLNYTLEQTRKLVATDTSGNLPNSELLKEMLKYNKHTEECNLQDFTSYPDTGLARILTKIFNLSMSTTLPENVQNVLQSSKSELTSDKLLSSLNGEEVLKPCLDIVLENCNSNKISVFEAGASHSALYRKVVPMITSHPMKTVNYTAADTSPLDKDAKGFGVKSSQWDLSTSTSALPKQVQLLILKNVLHKQVDIDTTLETVSTMIVPSGFLLIEEVTSNFPIFLALEGISDKLSNNSCSGVNRAFGRYLTEGSWEEVFSRHGYNVIYQKSDNLLSTVFLLRKRATKVQTQALLFIDDLQCSWLEELKSEVRKLESAPEEARLWLAAKDSIHGMVGFINCLRLEAGGSKVRSILVSNLSSSNVPEITANSPEFLKLVENDLVANVYRDGHWGSFRHLTLPTGVAAKEKRCEYAYVNILTKGDLSSLKWIESPLKFYQTNGHERDLCSVYYTSLNFHDVMLATGKLPADAIPEEMVTQDCVLGMEFAGRDSKGKRVMGIMSSKGMATAVETERHFLWDIPDHWSMEDASTVPVVYATTYYALVTRGRIRKGEKILIHSGSGGVGQAAISVALSYGCEVFTTVGTNEKKEYLKKIFPQLKDRNFSNSRDLSFEFHILKETKGKGVDLVLNSLAGEKLEASIRLLARHGRFLEIGKYDLSNDTPMGMSIFLKNINFCGIMVDELIEMHKSKDWDEVHELIRQGIVSGVVRPLRATVFGKDEVESAFRYMAQGKHIGKVVIQVRSEEQEKVAIAPAVSIPSIARTACDPSKTYVVVGGLGGFGLELAEWLVERGAKSLVIGSRSGIKTGYQYRKIQSWKQHGVTVRISNQDAITLQGAEALLQESKELGPLGGVFNLAMVLCDGLFENQTPEMYKTSIEPKILGTINLDKATRELYKNSLDWFVVFSSVGSGRGNLGQTNYGFANSVMERICERRKAQGYPALAIQWGAIGDVGVVAESMGGNETVISGTLPQRMASCLNALDNMLAQNATIVTSFVLAPAETERVKGAQVQVNLVDAVSRILGLKDASLVNPNTTLADLGLDSLMVVEIKQLLERDFDLSLSSRDIQLLNMKKLQEMGGSEEAVDYTDEQ